MRYIIALIIIVFWFAEPTKAQVFDVDAPYKTTLRDECFRRYGTDPGCGKLEPWFCRIDNILACQVVYGRMLSRFDVAFSLWVQQSTFGFVDVSAWQGQDFVGFGNNGVTTYVVPQLLPFHDYENSIGPNPTKPYKTLGESMTAHIAAGDLGIFIYQAEVRFLHQQETFHRGLVGLGPLPPPNPPALECE